AAIRHHILRARTTANENAEKKHAHCPDRNAASLQCFERTISHKNSSSAKRPISGRMGQAAEIDLNRAQIHLFVIGLRQGYFAPGRFWIRSSNCWRISSREESKFSHC